MSLIEDSSRIDGYVWRCKEKIKNKKGTSNCSHQVSLRTGTFMAKSHLSIFDIVSFCYFWIYNMSLNGIMRELRISSHAAGDWASYCHEVAIYAVMHNKRKIGGVGVVVEIDESKFGGRKYHVGQRVEGQWVFGGVERGTSKCFLVAVEKRDRNTLLPIIHDWILPGTTVISDCWKTYDCLSDEGYEHYRFNHSINFKDPETGAHTNTQEGLWRHVKASMPQIS